MQSKNVMQITNTLKNAGFQAFIAGGAVRDHLLGKTPKDIDFVTDATPDQVESIFSHTIPLGKSFGVIVVVMEDGEQFEIATFRKDSKNSDGRRPNSVSFNATMKEDASRRDFTINAMFLDPVNGEVFDFFNGQEDLKKKLIRFVGNPLDRVHEDKLRMLRAVRFASNLGFTLEGNTFVEIFKQASQICTVSAERIQQELMKMLGGPNPDKAVLLLTHLRLIHTILPEVQNMRGVEQPVEFHPEGDVFQHTIQVVKNLTGTGALTVLAGLLHDIGKPSTAKFNFEKNRVQFITHEKVGAEMAEKVMHRLKFSNDEIKEVAFAVRNHMHMHHFQDMRLAKQRMLAMDEHFTTLLHVGFADANEVNFKTLKAVSNVLLLPDPQRLVTGLDLIELGLKPGPQFTTILQSLRMAQLNGDIKTRNQALNHLRKKLS